MTKVLASSTTVLETTMLENYVHIQMVIET